MKSFADGVKAGLSRRYFFAIGGAVCLVLLLAIGIETPLAYRATLQRVGDAQLADLRAAASQVDQYLRHVETSLRESAAIPWVAGPFTGEDVRTELHRLMKVIPALDSVALADEAGTQQAFVSRLEPDAVSGPPLEAALLKRARTHGLAIGTVDFQDGTEAIVPIVVAGAESGRGFVAARLTLRNVSDIVGGVQVGSQGQAFLVDQTERLVAHRDAARTLQPLAQETRNHIAAIRARLQGDPPIAEPVPVTDAGHAPVLSSAVSLPRAGWLLVAEEPLEAALSPVRETLYRLFGVLLGGLLLALLISAAMARRLAGPIVSMRRAARRIAQGDLASRIEVRTGDEVEQLAHDFNHMAAQLQEYTTSLERKVAEQTGELRTALAAAQDAMRARSVFLAAASHDLRQPLYAIGILSDALAGQSLPAEAALVLDKQRKAISVLRSLFDNLLDLSRLEAGEIHPHERPVSLQELLAAPIAECQALAAAKGLDFRTEVENHTVRTDAELVRRVVGNLLSNAVRYTASGHVALRALREGDNVLVEVADTGIGIAKQDQERVFEEFVQVDNVARDRDRGVGLGLSIVRHISRLLGLGLEMESQPGLGTHFRLRLPWLEDAAATTDVAPLPPEPVALAAMRVWIVEDDPLVRDALEVQMLAWQVDYEFAASRSDLERLRESDGSWPDAVVLDDMLEGGENGLDIARWLAGHMPVACITLTTGNVEPMRLEALRGSGFRIALKPLSAEQLARCLEAASGLRSPQAVAP